MPSASALHVNSASHLSTPTLSCQDPTRDSSRLGSGTQPGPTFQPLAERGLFSHHSADRTLSAAQRA